MLNLIIADTRHYMKSPMQAFNTITFFLTATLLFPFAIGTGEKLSAMSAGGVWVVALMSISIATGQIFNTDKNDGTLDMWVSFAPSLYAISMARIISVCVVYGFSLCILAPIMASSLGLPYVYLSPLFLSLLFATPGLFAINIFASALTLGVRGGAVLSAIITLPFSIPFIIFGSGVVNTAKLGFEFQDALLLSGGISVIALILCPIAISACIKYQVSR